MVYTTQRRCYSYNIMHLRGYHNSALRILMMVCLALPLRSCRAFEFEENYYMKVDGYKMDEPLSEIYTVVNTVRTVTECAGHCSTLSTCKSLSYNTESRTCVLLSKEVYDMSVVSWLIDSKWATWMLVPERVNHSDWTLMFRGTAGIEYPIYDTFLDTSHDGKYEPGCLRLDNALPCQSHFRSPILNEWTNIDQVRVSLYKDGIEQQYIVLDGVNSTIKSWFSSDRIMESSWTKLQNTTFQHFKAKGSELPSGDLRRFYINVHHGGCDLDHGYLVILDTQIDFCYWATDSPLQATYPWILYSASNNTYTTWYDRVYGMADVFAVSVKFAP